MKQEDKELLLQILCSYLPYGIKVGIYMNTTGIYFTAVLRSVNPFNQTFQIGSEHYNDFSRCKPYLIPMSRMTTEDVERLSKETHCNIGWDSANIAESLTIMDNQSVLSNVAVINWLIKNHFDYMGLIPKGLALEGTEGMYVNV